MEKQKRNFKPVILVTGCGSGLGLALAGLLYTQHQYRVVITARESSMSYLKARFSEGDRFWICSLDVTDEAQREAVVEGVSAAWGGIDILINNAGVCFRSVVEHMSEEDELRQLATNFLGPMGLIRRVLPHMRNVGRGKIINVSSVSGMLAMPTMASYSASKHALEGASEALWYETKPWGINVTLVQPGFIRSRSFEKVCYSRAARLAECRGGHYADYYRNMTPFIRRLMNMSQSTPESVARLILGVIQKENPPLWRPATLDAYVFCFVRKLLPQWALLPMLYMALPGSSRWSARFTRRRTGASWINLNLRQPLRSLFEFIFN